MKKMPEKQNPVGSGKVPRLYDFVFSSHSLEHIANPLKAISEWLRITKKDGYIIIIVPEKRAYNKTSNFKIITAFNVSNGSLVIEKHDLQYKLLCTAFY